MTAGTETLKELIADAKDREGTVLDAAGRSAPYSYREFASNCYKAGNLLGHYGVHPGATVAVAVGPKEAPTASGAGDDVPGHLDSADPLLAILGGAAIGATVDVTPAEPVESRALVAGVLAPLSVGATVALPDGADDGGQTEGTEPALWVVADGGENDSTAVRAGDVTASLRGTDRA